MYSCWWRAVSQRIEKTSNKNYAWTLLFLFPLLSVVSSVAREGFEPPHWPKKYAKYHVFSAFEADFCSKNENSPPTEIGDEKLWRTCCDLDHGHHLKLLRKTDWILLKTFFFEITWFWTEKPIKIWWRPFFFLRSPYFGRKNQPTQSDQSSIKIWARSFDVFSSLQNSPPQCKFLATRLSAFVLSLRDTLKKYS